MVSLGCAKNLVDSENILGLLRQRGYAIASDINGAEVAIINTCGFIQSAVEECIDTIFDLAGLKASGDLDQLIVVGCFVQRYGYRLRQQIPEVDGWLGTGEIQRIVDLLESGPEKTVAPFYMGRPTFLADHTFPRIQTTPFYTAYLKIAEGCSHTCSFCTIPRLRGPLRSRNPESLVIEAGALAKRGVKEVNLIAQDSSMYGHDLEENVSLEILIEKLAGVEGIEWIRVNYCHPNRISDRLLNIMRHEERVCNYLDVPFQHVNREILEAMGRNPQGEDPRRLIDRIRAVDPEISIRTTLMVGFPGEDHEIFKELYAFVRDTEFDHLGVFVFSPEKGTRAARIKKAPGRDEAEERLDAIMSLQREISLKKNQRMINRTLPVLVEGPFEETDLLLKGRTSSMAPDVDGQVLINKGNTTEGAIVPVLITEAHPYDLIGEIV